MNDRYGHVLKVGDVVMVECVIIAPHAYVAGDDGILVKTVVTVSEAGGSQLSLNASQVEFHANAPTPINESVSGLPTGVVAKVEGGKVEYAGE